MILRTTALPLTSNPNSARLTYGQRWGPEKNKKDKYFGFLPGNGIHDIHMNQGNSGKFAQDNGSWQDGGLIIQLANQWIALFFKFQSQTWHSEDDNGEPIVTPDPEGSVLIIAALVNPFGDDKSKETVTLLNISPTVIDLFCHCSPLVICKLFKERF
jgi:hypothetical protein